MHKFKELRVWQKSMSFVEELYMATSTLPDIEKFGLRVQMNRAGVSIPSNIAEGAGRNSKKEFSQYLSISLGSSFELETQLILCARLKYISGEIINGILRLLIEIQNMLFFLRKTLENSFLKKLNTTFAISLIINLLIMCTLYLVHNT